jgi:deoxyribodipyrimidine photo-lyase
MDKKPSFKKALFIFHRDLRLFDNTGLAFALKHAKEVIPCFIFTPEQIEHNPYRNAHCLQFMIESLEDLQEELKAKRGRLYLFHGKQEKIVEKCIKTVGVDAVIINRDYTPYSIKRDQKIAITCKKHHTSFYSFDDLLLHPPEDTLKADGKPYAIFTPFYRHATKLEVANPLAPPSGSYSKAPISFAKTSEFYKKLLPTRSAQALGGRKSALKILKKIQHFSSYASLRNFPAKDETTHLSAHLKFTTCSIREVYHAIDQKLGSDSELLRALYWRDFFTSIAFFFPHVFKGAFHKKYNRLKWSYNKKAFELWCQGRTGFPIVDAGMREMNETGFMHNRVRMIVASFLIKDLHIDWRWGEKYFAKSLLDYDPAVNNGNWQWSASTGCDAQPYFRIFNPWNQQKKFDPECVYIKRWIPELSSLAPKIIHTWDLKERHPLCPSYPSPMVDHAKETKVALRTYKSI